MSRNKSVRITESHDAKFGDYIRRLMRAKGMETIRNLADESGIPEQTVARYLRGDRFPDSHALFALATALGVSMEHLLTAGQSLASDHPHGAKPESTRLPVPDADPFAHDLERVGAYMRGMNGAIREIYVSIGAMLAGISGRD